jgi:hypothetical protein
VCATINGLGGDKGDGSGMAHVFFFLQKQLVTRSCERSEKRGFINFDVKNDVKINVKQKTVRFIAHIYQNIFSGEESNFIYIRLKCIDTYLYL